MVRIETDKMVAELLSRAPLGLRALKQHYAVAERMLLRDFIELEMAHHREIATTDDTREGFRAFLEKRPPQFQGI